MKKNVILALLAVGLLTSCGTMKKVATTTKTGAQSVLKFNEKLQKQEFVQQNFSGVSESLAEEGIFQKFFTGAAGDTVRIEDWKMFDGQKIIKKAWYRENGAEVTLTLQHNDADVETFNDLRQTGASYAVTYGDKKSLSSEWDLAKFDSPTDPFKLRTATDHNVGFLSPFHELSSLLVFCENEKSQIDTIPEKVAEYIALENGEHSEKGTVDRTITKKVEKDSIVTTSTEVGAYKVIAPTQEEISRNQNGLVVKKFIPGTKVSRRIEYTINLQWIGTGEDVVATGTILINGVSLPIKCTRSGYTFTETVTVNGTAYTWKRVQK